MAAASLHPIPFLASAPGVRAGWLQASSEPLPPFTAETAPGHGQPAAAATGRRGGAVLGGAGAAVALCGWLRAGGRSQRHCLAGRSRGRRGVRPALSRRLAQNERSGSDSGGAGPVTREAPPRAKKSGGKSEAGRASGSKQQREQQQQRKLTAIRRAATTLRKMQAQLESDENIDTEEVIKSLSEDLANAPSVPARYGDVRARTLLPRAIPFLPEPAYRSFLTRAAGDAGFDPLGLCKDAKDFEQYRTAEIKHSRLAMIAAVGWPLAEVFVPLSSEEYGLPDVLADYGGRLLPTSLTGGISDTFVETLVSAVFIVGATAELFRPEGGAPGDLGLSWGGFKTWRGPPLLNKLLPRGRFWMQEAELKHGRIAMVAIFFDILTELLTGNPVVEDSEYLFHRIDAKFFRQEYWLSQPAELLSPDLLEATDVFGAM